MERLYKPGLFLFLFIFLGVKVYSQSLNYWSVNLNSEAALLGGAVVGGGAGITAIFYNPAGISEVKNNNVSLNSSMFTFRFKNYSNALGSNENMSQYTFYMTPRFASYTIRSKKIIKLSWELAIFNRDSRDVFIHGSYLDDAGKYGYPNENYFGSYEYWERYNDYYVGIGASYEFNNKFVVGFSIFGSLKDLRAVNNRNTAIYNHDLTEYPDFTANWYSYKRVGFIDVRLVPKFGVKYLINKEISLGITLNFPSLELFNYAEGKKILSRTNIKDNNGYPVPDFFYEETVEYVTAKFKDPFSVAVGVRRKPVGSKNIYSLTVEWFTRIKPYKAIDAESGKSIFGESVYGTEFSNYYYGNRAIMNFAFGYKREVARNFELLFGFKSDFFSYHLPESFMENHKNANTFVKVGTDMLHLSAGANFIFRKKFKINLGSSLSYGRLINNKQFINFVDPNWYDYNTDLALQGKRKSEMIYTHIMLGLFIGFSLNF